MASSYIKRGHNKDFALTDAQLREVIRTATSQKTKKVLQLCAEGKRVAEISEIMGVSPENVWRRVKRAMEHASYAGIIPFEKDNLPFPEALRYKKREVGVIHLRLENMAKRVHFLNGGIMDKRDPLKDCLHTDCMEFRVILKLYTSERANSITVTPPLP